MTRIVFLGYGNVGGHLCNALHKQEEITVVQVYSRTQNALKKVPKQIATTTDITSIVEADVYIIAIPDDAIRIFSENLIVKNALVVHTSGSAPMDAIHSKHRQGVFYPLQTFSKEVTPDFTTIPFCIEAAIKTDEALLCNIASSISNNVQLISSKKRETIHIAAVIVNNFVNQLYKISEDLLEEHQLDFDILKPLILETAQKITRLSPKEAQTGPAKRGDQEVIQKHISKLKSPSHQDVYKLITQAIIATHNTAT